MTERIFKKSDVVQLNERCANSMLRYCYMTITETKAWGAMGFVQCPGQDGEVGSQAYYRAKFLEMDFIGVSPFVIDEREQGSEAKNDSEG